MNDPFIGSIIMFAGNFAPSGWALCNGQLIAISQNTALFSILGTTYGGDGQTTFALPDLRGRIPIHAGQGLGLSPYVLGEVTGVEHVTLLSNNMPIHNHQVNASTSTAGRSGGTPANNLLAMPANSVEIYASGNPGTTMSSQMIGIAGGNLPFSVIQPVLCVNFIIALYGIFPSRN